MKLEQIVKKTGAKKPRPRRGSASQRPLIVNRRLVLCLAVKFVAARDQRADGDRAGLLRHVVERGGIVLDWPSPQEGMPRHLAA